MKKLYRRSISGLMALLICFTTILGGGITAFAASSSGEVAKSYSIGFPRSGDTNLDYSGTWGHDELHAARGKLTSTMPQTQPEQATEEIKPVGDMPETGLLAENRAKGTEESGTELLAKEEPTGVLFDENATEPLTDHPNGVKQHVVRGKKLQMIEEVILIHDLYDSLVDSDATYVQTDEEIAKGLTMGG